MTKPDASSSTSSAASPGHPSGAPPMGVILAAGKGTRMRPFSEHYPKPILPVLEPWVARYGYTM